MNYQLEDLKFRSRLKGMRRKLAHSADGAAVAVHRDLYADRRHSDEFWENWPRQTMPRSRIRRRAGAFFLLATVVLLIVVLLEMTGEWHEPRSPLVTPSGRDDGAAKSTASLVPSASSPIVTADPFVIRLRASRSCHVRVMVDGIALDWRPLHEGDEILARPRQEMLIESDDGEALSATVNGKAISLEAHRRDASFRLTSESLFANPVLAP